MELYISLSIKLKAATENEEIEEMERLLVEIEKTIQKEKIPKDDIEKLAKARSIIENKKKRSSMKLGVDVVRFPRLIYLNWIDGTFQKSILSLIERFKIIKESFI